MVGILRVPAKTQRLIFGASLIAVMGLLACLAGIALAGTKTGAILSIGLTIGPVLLYTAIISPIAFPFSIYGMLVQLDTLLNVPGFGTITKFIGIASAAAFLFYMIRTKQAVQPPRVTLVWLIFYLWATSTIWWALDTDASTHLIGISWSLFLLFFVVSMLRLNSKMLLAAIAATLLGGVLSSLYGIYFFHFHGAEGLSGHSGRLYIQTDEGIVNPDHFGNSFILPASFALIGALWARGTLKKIAYLGALLLMLVAMALAGGRGAMLGFACVVVFLLVRDRHRLQLAWVMGISAFVAVAAAGSLLAARFSTALSTGGAGRTQIWKAGFAAFKEFWLFGAGYGNFPEAYNRYYLSVFQPNDPHFFRASHNILLNAAVELGVIGLTLLIAGWVQTFRLLNPISEDDYRFPLKLGLQGAIIGLFVSGLFVDLMIMKYVWMAFMLTVMTYNAGPVYTSALSRRTMPMEVEATPSA